jgi:hypothetical protein
MKAAREAGGARPLVECPGCHYRPTPFDLWQCTPDGCGHIWDTFATAARCPGCGAQFPWTACPACGQVFPHRAWYL